MNRENMIITRKPTVKETLEELAATEVFAQPESTCQFRGDENRARCVASTSVLGAQGLQRS